VVSDFSSTGQKVILGGNCTRTHSKHTTATALTGNLLPSELFGSALAAHLLSAFGSDARFMLMLMISPGFNIILF